MTASTPSARNGCKRNLGGEFRRFARLEEGVPLAQGAILGQVAPGLAHHPHGDALGWLGTTCAKEQGLAAGEIARLAHARRFERHDNKCTPVAHPNRAACSALVSGNPTYQEFACCWG